MKTDAICKRLREIAANGWATEVIFAGQEACVTLLLFGQFVYPLHCAADLCGGMVDFSGIVGGSGGQEHVHLLAALSYALAGCVPSPASHLRYQSNGR